MRAWPFKKPKTPGFGIGANFYLSVLSTRTQLPKLSEVANPKGERGAVPGLPARWHEDARKEEVDMQIERGAYLLASPDMKTALRMIVVPKEEAFFDPEVFLSSTVGQGVDAEKAARLRATWTLLQLSFSAHDPMVYPALDYLELIAVRLSLLTEGLIADPICRRYMLPHELIAPIRADPKVDAREHVAALSEGEADGISSFTLGMQKFVSPKGAPMPEFEVRGFSEALRPSAESMLLGLCQAVLMGRRVEEGDTIGERGAELEVRQGGLDLRRWEGISVLELIPGRGRDLDASIQAMARG